MVHEGTGRDGYASECRLWAARDAVCGLEDARASHASPSRRYLTPPAPQVAVLAALCAPGQDVAAFGRPAAVAPRLRGAGGPPGTTGACLAGSRRPAMDQLAAAGARRACRWGPVHGGEGQRPALLPQQTVDRRVLCAGAGPGREPEGGDLRFPAHLLQRDGWPGPGNDDSWKSLERVFVILFGIPGGGEGIYSLQTSSVSAVLIFEDEDDATRYGDMLEAEGTNTGTCERPGTCERALGEEVLV